MKLIKIKTRNKISKYKQLVNSLKIYKYSILKSNSNKLLNVKNLGFMC